MRLEAATARDRFAASRVARLATITQDGRPHLVPIVFAVDGDVIYTAVDGKAKTTTSLRRLANIGAHPQVAVLADHYTDDWTQLWWARADGSARIAAGTEADAALDLLRGRYPVYLTEPPPGPVIAVDVARWTGWQAQEPP